MVDLEIDGQPARYALGAEVTVGRGDATIVVASRAASRKHLRIRRAPGGGFLAEDLDTRNGTLLAGARITGAIPVGEGLHLELGGEVPCEITPRADGNLDIEIGGLNYVAPLGELTIDGWAVDHEAVRDESFVVLRSPPGAQRPYLGISSSRRASSSAPGTRSDPRAAARCGSACPRRTRDRAPRKRR